jgi:hypothetical protein
MLTFVEAGTDQAADLGFGDEAYFAALQIRLDAVAKELHTLPAEMRANVRARLGRIQMRQRHLRIVDAALAAAAPNPTLSPGRKVPQITSARLRSAAGRESRQRP